jgi:hypothetical protein
MLFREIIAAYCENYTKTQQNKNMGVNEGVRILKLPGSDLRDNDRV